MKKSYIKLYIFIFIVALLLLLNVLIFKIISKYYLALFIMVLLILFKIFFGFEKDKNIHPKEILFQILIFLLCFFILYYMLGILIGFARTSNYFTISGLTKFILPIIIYVILKEILRYMMLIKSSENRLLIVLTTILFILIDINISLSIINFNTSREIFMFFALTGLPIIGENIACSFLSLKYGYKPNIVYLLIINLYIYIMPITPNPDEYLYSIVAFILPILLLFNIDNYIARYKDEELTRNYNKTSNYLLLIPAAIIIVLVYFTSGEFKYYSIAIASGSMEKAIYRGDIVISKRIDSNDELKKGVILAYNHENRIIVHRITEVVDSEDGLIIYTKGDNNLNVDSYKVTEDMIIGVVNNKIPYIGYLTVLLSELR